MDDPDADQRMLERTYLRFGAVNDVVSRPGLLYRRDIRPRRVRGRAMRILDVGSGGGDLCRLLARRLRRDGIAAEITALDPEARAIAWSREHDGGAGIRHRIGVSTDLVAAGDRFDVVLSNHMLHHLTADELEALLGDSRRLIEPGGLILHRDIARSRTAYIAFGVSTLPFAGNLLAGSFIRDDGLTSIRRSYTVRELRRVVPPGWQVRAGFPSRLELRWEHADDRP